MKHTQSQLEAMCDAGINRLIEMHINPAFNIYYVAPKDYCNNPSEIMPIAIENKINLQLQTSDGQANAFKFKDDTGVGWNIWHKNPYRAIAIVYLLLKGESDD